MPRTWGYIIVVLAAIVGAGALLLPVPEEIEVEAPESAPTGAPGKAPRAVAPPPAASRAARKPSASPPPPAPPAAAKPATPSPRPFPMQDTTKTRTMVQPKPPAN